MIELAIKKTSHSFGVAFVRAVLANWLVCLVSGTITVQPWLHSAAAAHLQAPGFGGPRGPLGVPSLLRMCRSAWKLADV